MRENSTNFVSLEREHKNYEILRAKILILFLLNFYFVIVHFRYGYIDPRGDVREFTYKSGIPCDPETKQPLQPDRNSQKPVRNKKGYFDYSDNRFVLPSGRRVKVVVNKANRARG